MPTGFGGQQQSQQPGRAVSNRLPNGKLGTRPEVQVGRGIGLGLPGVETVVDTVLRTTGSNSSGWAFGGGVPMSGAGLQNPTRQLGGNVSFAQSLTGSQPATPLDLSYVLSCHILSTSPATLSPAQCTLWIWCYGHLQSQSWSGKPTSCHHYQCLEKIPKEGSRMRPC